MHVYRCHNQFNWDSFRATTKNGTQLWISVTVAEKMSKDWQECMTVRNEMQVNNGMTTGMHDWLTARSATEGWQTMILFDAVEIIPTTAFQDPAAQHQRCTKS